VNVRREDWEPSEYQIGLRAMLAVVSYLAISFGCLRLLLPVNNLSDLTALALSLGATIRPIYMLVRGSLDHIWYEDSCIERGFLSRSFDVPPEMSDLGLFQFCALCMASSVLGAIMVLVLLFVLMSVGLLWMLFA
jgi:hypothetical protein